MNELWDSFSENVKSRMGSPMYGTFIISWLIVNRPLRFIAFFVSEENILKATGLMKHEYILCYYDLLERITKSIILPTVMVYLVYRWSSKLEKIIYTKSVQNKMSKDRTLLEEQIKFEKTKGSLLETKEKNLDKEEKIKQKEETLKSEKEIWDEEYMKIGEIYGDTFQSKLDEITSYFTLTLNGRPGNLSSEVRVFAYINGLSVGDVHHHELTDKGKYFLKKYNESKVSLPQP